ncbi:methyl-accepting chemotaxis protein [Alsobacter sp. R-9]
MNGHSRLRLAVLGGTLMLLCALWYGAMLLVERGWTTASQQAEDALARTGRAAESITNRNLLQVDSVLVGLPELLSSLAMSPAGTAHPVAARRLLQSLASQTFVFRDLLLVRPGGEVWTSARPGGRGRSAVTGNDGLPGPDAPGSSAVYGPVRNPSTGEWSLYLGRTVSVPGAGEMLALAEIPISSLTTALAPIGEMPGLDIALVRADGRLVASMPHDELNVGRVRDPGIPQVTSAPEMVPRQDGAGADMVFARPTLFGDLRIVLRLDGPVAMRDWARDREHLMYAAATASVMLALFALIVLAGLLNRDRLDRERRDAQRTLEDAIDSMSDGFVMWDASDRLAACNEPFRRLYAASRPWTKHGSTFEAFVRGGAGHGQYPGAGTEESFVQAMIERHRAGEGSHELLLPDGRWLLVTERATASGGVVGVHKDITERKRQEDLILRYSEELERLAFRFETSVKSGASQVEQSAIAASTEVDNMATAASEAVAQARFVSSEAEGTSSRVRVVAANIEQLQSSILQISQRVETAARMTDKAAECSRVATGIMAGLDAAASQITSVVDLIHALARQTNLLALNATIEAARAGEAGRGFAVVAAEVKALAAQTANSTDMIARHVQAIQQSSSAATDSIETINRIVADLKDIGATIECAVREQSDAASEITASTIETAHSTSEVTSAVVMIANRSEQISRSTEGLRHTAQRLLAEARTLGTESNRFLAGVQTRR